MVEYLLQTLYIKTLNPTVALTGKMSEKAKDAVVFWCLTIVNIYFVIIRSPVFFPAFSSVLPSLFEGHVFGSVILILIAVFSCKGELQYVKWRRIVVYPQLLLGLLLVLTGFLHPIGAGYRTFGFMLILIYPCLCFVWNNRADYGKLFYYVVCSMILVNMALFFISFYYACTDGFSHREGVRCIGIMTNANCFSLIGLELFIGALYLLAIRKKHHLGFTLFLFAVLGTGLGIILIGQMRIAIIAVVICVPVVLFFRFRHGIVVHDKLKVTHLIVCLLFMTAMTVQAFVLVQIDNQVTERLKTEGNLSNEAVEQAEDQPNVMDRFSANGKDANAFSSGRVNIWKNYAGELNWTGHDRDQYDMKRMVGDIPYPYAHNMFFEVGYRCGIPAGVVSVLLLLIVGVISIRYLFCAYDRKGFLLFPVLVCIVFALEAMLDCAFLPFFQLEDFWYYLCFTVFIDPNLPICRFKQGVQNE